MAVRLADFIRLYQMPSGRALYLLKQIIAAATALEVPAILAIAERALAQARATRELELQHRRWTQAPLYSPEAAGLDVALDRALSALAATLRANIEINAGRTDDPIAAAARRVEAALFPNGVNHLTRLSYVEEHESVALLLAAATTGSLAADIDTLGARHFIERISAINAEFGTKLDAAPNDGPSWDKIRGHRAQLHDSLLELVAVALGTWPTDSDEDAANRAAVLGPLSVQQEALARQYSARARTRDIDPETGVEVDEPPIEPETDA